MTGQLVRATLCSRRNDLETTVTQGNVGLRGKPSNTPPEKDLRGEKSPGDLGNPQMSGFSDQRGTREQKETRRLVCRCSMPSTNQGSKKFLLLRPQPETLAHDVHPYTVCQLRVIPQFRPNLNYSLSGQHSVSLAVLTQVLVQEARQSVQTPPRYYLFVLKGSIIILHSEY